MVTNVHKTTLEAAAQITRPGAHWGPTLGAAAGPISFGFSTSVVSYFISNSVNGTFSPLTAAEQTAARTALALWADVASITFNDLGSSNNAAIQFSNYQANDNRGAFAFLPDNGNTSAGNSEGDVFLNLTAVQPNNLEFGSYSFQTLLHEIGHALGLDHPGDYNAAPGVKFIYDESAEYIEDSEQYSVMSYFDESSTGADYAGYPVTPQLHDIAAIQRLYGANTTTRTDNSIYGFNSNAGSVYAIGSTSQLARFTVWDAGGTDTFDFSGYAQDQVIDLEAESFSNIGGLTSNVAIALGVTIELAVGGSGSDRIIGNQVANILRGGLGNDAIDGGGGTDSAAFSGARSAYTFTALAGGGVRVNGPDGSDTLTSVERLVFTDQTVTWPESSVDDFADTLTDTTSPFGQAAVNTPSTGNLEAAGDRDWFRIQLTGGIAYTIDLQGQQAGAGTLEDPYLRVHNSTGATLAENDDIVNGVQRDSQLIYTATATGTYFLEAGAFEDGFSGTYRVNVSTATTAGDDFADTLTDATRPFGQIAVNGSNTGNLEVTGDRDWFRVELTAGTTYTIDLQGQGAGNGTLEDPLLRLHGNSAASVAENDDILLGENRDSRLTYLATSTGTYFLEAGAFDDDYIGTYKVSISASAAPGDDFADTLGDATAPFGQVTANIPKTGRLEVAGDHDWFRVQLTAGTSYTIELQGQGTGVGTLEDPYLRLHDSAGAMLAEQDDIVLGVDRDSRLAYHATATGTFYLEAGAFDDDYAGTYRLTVATARSARSDFNGDGKSDILWQNTNGQAAVWELDGTSIIGAGTVGPNPGTSWQAIASGDFNGDGKSDILWQNTNGQAAVWELDGTSIIETGTVGPNPGPSWTVRATGDTNGDGKSDIIFQHTNGSVGIWELDGTQIVGGLGILVASADASWIIV